MALADIIANAVQSVDYPVTILASSDMSHYLADRAARLKDKIAIDKMLISTLKGYIIR